MNGDFYGEMIDQSLKGCARLVGIAIVAGIIVGVAVGFAIAHWGLS